MENFNLSLNEFSDEWDDDYDENNFVVVVNEDSDEYVVCLLKQFFSTKSMYCGGVIPNEIFLSDYYMNCIKNIRNVSLIDMVDLVYEFLGFNDENRKLISDSLTSLCMGGVPKEYSVLLLPMYLELICGINMVNFLNLRTQCIAI
jgi:hypothetical protein